MKLTTPKDWHCVAHCGACCYLEPGDRTELEDYLSEDELKQYLSLVGEDGWCIHYDHQQRHCSIYEERPAFCRVTLQTFQRMFGVAGEDLSEFAAACCREHIGDIYGAKSPEMTRFNEEVPIGLDEDPVDLERDGSEEA